jgi:hypothetical protein
MRRSIFILCVLAMGVAEYASACSVCFAGETNTRQAFYTTAVALTVLPLIMIGGGAYALNRRMRKLAQEEEKLNGALLRQDNSR